MSNELDDLRAALSNDDRPVDAAIARDMPCMRCGYNLRGIAENTNCPECGSAVGMSLYGDRLKYADPIWLATVRRGLIFMCLSAVAWLPLFGIATIIIGVLRLPPLAIVATFLTVPIATGILLAVGAFMMTTIEPRLKLDEAPMTARRFVRFMSIAAGFAIPAYLLPTVLGSQPGHYREFKPSPELDLVLRLGLLTVPALIYGCLIHLRQFARRIPEPALVSFTSIVIVGLPVSIIAAILMPLDSPDVVRMIVVFVTGAFSIWTIMLIWSYAGILDEPAAAAKRNARKRR